MITASLQIKIETASGRWQLRRLQCPVHRWPRRYIPRDPAYCSYPPFCLLMQLTSLPSQPFPLDYHQTLLSLLDVLSEVYAKLGRILGPSPFPHSSQHMMGPLGLLAPHPGVSYLFSGAEALPKDDVKDEGSLWGIAHAYAPQNAMGAGVGGAGYTNAGGLSSPPPSWTPVLAEMVLKVDGKFKVRLSLLILCPECVFNCCLRRK